MKIEEFIIQELNNRGKTLCLAESCTGGLIANRLTNISGSSSSFLLGIISYSNQSKQDLLEVPFTLLQKYGAVSEPVAIAMAQGIRRIYDADLSLGITGIAGPTGATKNKPVGLVFIAACTEQETLCLKCEFAGSRTEIKQKAANQALKLLKEFLL